MAAQEIEPLSERELELVELLAEGLTNKQIAQELYISPNTVKVHLRNIYAKLKVSSRTEATMVALRMGWVELEGVTDEEQASLSADERDESGVEEGAIPQREPLMAPWKHIYLVVAIVVVAFGSWLFWPREAAPAGPFTDRRPDVATWVPGQRSRWQELSQMPLPRSRFALVAHEGRIYAIAGETMSGVTSMVQSYDPEADDWTSGADKPTAVANVGAVAIGNRIYVPGGSLSDGQMSARLEILDLGSDTWLDGQSLPRGICAYAIAAYEGDLYLFGGWDGVSYRAESYLYDSEQGAWTTLAPMPAGRAFAGAGVVGERIYVVGGFDGEQELDTCQVYDPATDLWEPCPPMKAPRAGLGTAVIGDTLYAIGGGWESYLVENEYFSPQSTDPTGGSWQTFPSPFLQEWRNLGVAANQTTLYAIGGWDGGYLAANRAYRAIYRLYLPSTIGQPSSPE
jgi:DNA-binding CsgD family transcriptional regulator/N-acetylneuraminic acid mutarotase